MKILIVVDMQNDFVTGPLGTPEARGIVPKVKAKIDEYVANNDPIIFTQDTHFESYFDTKEGKMLPVEHCRYKTDGWQIINGLEPSSEKLKGYGYDTGIHYIQKYTFGSKKLPDIIQHYIDTYVIDEIEFVGVCTDICVVSNALLLKSRFYLVHDIFVDANCCAGTTPEMHEAALKVMESCQIIVKRG